MLVLAILGALLLNPPLLEVFTADGNSVFFGWPLHVIYLYLVWVALILLAAWPVKRQKQRRKRKLRQDGRAAGANDDV